MHLPHDFGVLTLRTCAQSCASTGRRCTCNLIFLVIPVVSVFSVPKLIQLYGRGHFLRISRPPCVDFVAPGSGLANPLTWVWWRRWRWPPNLGFKLCDQHPLDPKPTISSMVCIARSVISIRIANDDLDVWNEVQPISLSGRIEGLSQA